MLLLVAALSGCAGNSPGSAPASASSVVTASDAAAPGQGSIIGVVVSDDELPIPGASVSITRPATLEATTDAEGRFEFRQLEPGPYSVYAQRLGFESVARNVDVVAGEETQLRLILKPIYVATAYNSTQIAKGLWQCHVPILLVVVNCADAQQLTGPRADSVTIEVPKGWHSSVFELTWRDTGSGLTSAPGVYCLDNTAKDGTTTDPQRAPKKPLRLLFTATDLDQGGPKYAHRANCYPIGNYNDVGTSHNGFAVVLDQTWTVYLTTFFVEPPYAGFTAIPPE
jgi:hypothetical protein